MRIDALSRDQAATAVVATARTGQGAGVHLCNAFTLSLTHRDAGFAAEIDAGDLNLMDGMPLVWTARRLGFDHCTQRVYGPDLMLDVMDRGREAGLRHYLYGSSPEVIAALLPRLRDRLPGVDIVGAESPPFRPLEAAEEEDTARRLAATDADVIWVGLGTPRQDRFVARFRDHVPATLVAVGAAFDFHAGAKKQAPRWLQERGLEWAYRLITEPRRLWRRYLIGNAVFLAGLARGVEVVRR